MISIYVLHVVCKKISTHSLTGRLTEVDDEANWTKAFQLTAPQGGWLVTNHLTDTKEYFNSQPHKGADGAFEDSCKLSYDFNSQPHKGADPAFGDIWLDSSISTHSPTRGLTPRIQMLIWCSLFQLTAPQGGWRFVLRHFAVKKQFQLTAPQGGWLICSEVPW